MLGQIAYDRERAGKMQRSMIGGTAVLTAFVPEGRGVRCALFARRAARQLAHSHVSLAAFPQAYPYLRVFSERGIFPPEELRLRRACADKIVLQWLRQTGQPPQEASVAVIASEGGAELARAVLALARCVRYLTLAVPRGEALVQQLRLLCGISVRLCPAQACGGLTVLWDGERAEAPPPVLCLADKTLQIDCRLAGQEHIAHGLLAALVQSEPQYAKQVEVCGVRYTESQSRGFFP